MVQFVAPNPSIGIVATNGLGVKVPAMNGVKKRNGKFEMRTSMRSSEVPESNLVTVTFAAVSPKRPGPPPDGAAGLL